MKLADWRGGGPTPAGVVVAAAGAALAGVVGTFAPAAAPAVALTALALPALDIWLAARPRTLTFTLGTPATASLAEAIPPPCG